MAFVCADMASAAGTPKGTWDVLRDSHHSPLSSLYVLLGLPLLCDLGKAAPSSPVSLAHGAAPKLSPQL